MIGNTLFTLGQVFIAIVVGFTAITEIKGMLSSSDLGEKFKHAFWASFFTYLLFRIWYTIYSYIKFCFEIRNTGGGL